jgi:hypothetical protein
MTGPVPTQTRHPWRAAIRTAFQVTLALASLLPAILAGVDVPVGGMFTQVIAVAAGITRVMAMPEVSTFLERFAPWLLPQTPTKTTPE